MWKLVSHQERDVLHGKEREGAFEAVRPDGTKEVRPYYQRTVELDDSTIQVSWLAQPRLGPLTIIRSIRRGRVEGNLRRDNIQTTIILHDGSIHRSPEVQMAVPVPSVLTGMSPTEAASYVHDHLTEFFVGIGQPATPEEFMKAVGDFNRRRRGAEPEK